MTAPPIPSALAEPTVRVRAGFLAALAVANLGIMAAFFAPIQNLLPRLTETVAGDVSKEAALAVVTTAGAIAAMVFSPIAGALSDRTVSRFGRRRPWILGGCLLGAVSVCLLGTQTTIIGLAIVWAVGQTTLNAAYAGLTAAIPDQVPVDQRGTASGWVGLSQTVGVVIGVAAVAFVVTDLTGGTYLIAALVVLLSLPLVLRMRDVPLDRAQRPPFAWSSFVRGFWVSPRQHPDFAWAWLGRFLVSLGSAMATGYLLFFLKDRVGLADDAAGQAQSLLIALYALGTIVTAVIGGVLSDRSGRRKPYVIAATLVMAVAALILVGTTTVPLAMVAALILGAGYGIYLAVDQALITQVLPAAADRARDLGVINIANTMPQAIAPAIAAVLVISLGGYPMLYVATAIVSLLGAAAIVPIRSVR